MSNAPLSLYYTTQLQDQLWNSLYKQYEAESFYSGGPFNNTDIDWKDLKDYGHTFFGEGFFIPEKADNTDMDANPYRRYCRDHQLPIGTAVSKVSCLKYRTLVVITIAAECLKYLIAAIESLAVKLLSIGFKVGSKVGQFFFLNSLCPSRVKNMLNTTKQTLANREKSIRTIFGYSMIALIYSLYSPAVIYGHLNNHNIGGFHKDFSNQMAKLRA